MKNIWNWIIKRKQIIEVVLILFVPQTCLVIANKSWQAMLMFLICSLVVCILFFQDRINKLKFSKDGLEIDLQKAIEEAYATIDNIKDITNPIINFNLQEMAGEDEISNGTKSYERIAFFKKAREMSKKLELDSPELKNSFSKAKSAIIQSFYWDIEDEFGKVIDKCKATDIADAVIGNTMNPPYIVHANMHVFEKHIKELPEIEQYGVQALYDSLEKFLKETSDIDDNFH